MFKGCGRDAAKAIKTTDKKLLISVFKALAHPDKFFKMYDENETESGQADL